jgi:AraC-like DNA-binding protein
LLAKINTQYCAQIIQTDKLLSSSYSFPHNTLEDIEESLQEQMKSIIQDIVSISDSSEDLSKNMMDYILNNYNRDISIDEISRNLGISYSYTRKLFKEKTGTSILDYINEIRIDKSKDLLLKTDHTYKEIAEMLGYNNEQSYVRYFKKYMCITPNSFRKRQRNLLKGENSYHN